MPGIRFELVKAPTSITFLADAQGRLLRFSGAILARAEENKNADIITAAGIDELAATIAGNAIDIEHEERELCGIFTAGAGVDDPELGRVLGVDGLIHADRFPEIAAGMQNGTLSLSIEADGKQATCSICGGIFASADTYCPHLQNKFKSGAKRTVEGLTALGGGVVRRPAGNGTDFSKANIRFVASHAEPDPAPSPKSLEALMKNCPYCNTALTASVEACPSCGKGLTLVAMSTELAAALASLNTLGTEKTALGTQLTDLTAGKSTLQASLDEAQSKLTAAQATIEAQKEKMRRAALGARMTDEVWGQKKVHILAMTDDAFAVMLDLAPAKTPAPGPAGVRIDADATEDEAADKFELTL